MAQSELDALVAGAVDAHPSLAGLRHQESAVRERASVAGAWPDPVVGVEYSNAPVTTLGLSDHPMSGLQLRVQQTLPPPGWSRARRTVLDQSADASAHAIDEAALSLELALRQAWWQLARTRLLRELTHSHQARSDELLAVARVRYETGDVGQHAILRLEVLRDRLADDLGEFDQQEAVLSAALDQATAADTPGSYPTPTTVAAAPPPATSDWVALAIEHRPLLAQLRAQEEVSHSQANLARLDALPDPSVWAGYRARSIDTLTDPGTDLVSVGVGVPIPTGSGRRAGGERSAALHQASAASAQHDAALDGIVADMRAIHARWVRAANKVATYDATLLPAARATVQTTRSDFSVGRAQFASLFEAEVALLDLERARITAATDTHLLAAQARATLGTPAPEGTP